VRSLKSGRAFFGVGAEAVRGEEGALRFIEGIISWSLDTE